jgi:protein farnesyltransferase subunit beta
MTTPFNERRRLPLPSVTDGLDTHTSRVQAETEEVLLNHIPDIPGAVPTLQDTAHKQFLARNLIQGFPARYQAYDASQPWLMYWTMQAFAALQVGMDPDNKKKCARPIFYSYLL